MYLVVSKEKEKENCDCFVRNSKNLQKIEYNKKFIDAQHITYKLKTRNKLNNLATLNIKLMN